ncbi:MAG: ATP-binding protein [Pseudodesulfovibrio sp.]
MHFSEWTPAQKISIVLEGLKGASETELLAKHGVSSNLYQQWCGQFMEYAEHGFANEIPADNDQTQAEKLSRSYIFSALLNSIPHAVFCKDTKGRFTYGNDAYCRVVKIPFEGLIGQDDFDLHTPEAAEKYRADDRKVIDTGQMFSCQEKNVHKDGTTLWAEVIKAPVRDEQDNTLGVMGMFWDITEQKNIEEELRKSQENLGFTVDKRTRELMEVNKRLEAGNKLKSIFMTSVSHELRTPLTSVLGFAKLITRDLEKISEKCDNPCPHCTQTSDRISGNALIIGEEAQRLKRLIDDLLDLGKFESGKMTWNDAVVDLNHVIDDSIGTMKGLFASNPRVDIRSELGTQAIHVKIDQDRLKQIMINLLNNAFKFTEKGHVTIETTTVDNIWAQTSVTDTGQGISQHDIALIFENYYQGVQSTIHEKGTGLGLSICHQIITHYGGKFWAESAQGKGTTFFFRLPLIKQS